MANRIQVRRDTTSSWNRVNPILADGEPALDITTNQMKYGDGNTPYKDLPFASFPKGGIVMWSGSAGTIPLGWALCNGSNGTPNLQDRFIIGAGSTYSVGNTGGTPNAIVVSHTHTASTSITEMAHAHWISGASKDDGNFSGSGLNTQDWGLYADAGTYSSTDPNSAYGRYSGTANTNITAGTTVSTEGLNGTNANLPPYYALCFIMKL
jgi:hypothetical protein